MLNGNGMGLSEGTTDPVSVELESGWTVGGFNRHFFCRRFRWDILLLQERFKKLDGVNVSAHELLTPSELVGGLRCPAAITHQ